MKKMLVWALGSVLFIGCNGGKATEPKTESSVATDSAQPKTQPVEFADAKYAEIGRQGVADLSSGDIDGWMKSFAENAVYLWNNGDSLAGKAAITGYWKKRRTEMIDSISFSNQVWLPLKVNQPQSIEQPGIWVLGWYMVNAKYKTGKRMQQWIHTDMHFDATDKIDRVIQYLDRVPINAAMAK